METGNFSGFHLYRNYPGIPVYATNFRIIPFPKWKFFSGKMETLTFIIAIIIRKKSHIDGLKINCRLILKKNTNCLYINRWQHF